MGFARKMKKKSNNTFDALVDAAMDDPVFVRAMEFDEGAAELGEDEVLICRMDSSPLEWVRGMVLSIWHGTQNQYECPVCRAKYVQFVPDEGTAH